MKLLKQWDWKTAVVSTIIVLAVIVAFNIKSSSVDESPIPIGQSGRATTFERTIADGVTGDVPAGDTVRIDGWETVLVDIISSDTAAFTIQFSYDECASWSTQNVFTYSTTEPSFTKAYRQSLIDCIRVNIDWTTGIYDIEIRGIYYK